VVRRTENWAACALSRHCAVVQHSYLSGEIQWAGWCAGLQTMQPREYFKKNFMHPFIFSNISNTGILMTNFTGCFQSHICACCNFISFNFKITMKNNRVKYLHSINSSQLSLALKTEIKNLVHETPYLIISQSSSSRKLMWEKLGTHHLIVFVQSTFSIVIQSIQHHKRSNIHLYNTYYNRPSFSENMNSTRGIYVWWLQETVSYLIYLFLRYD
jgi:hypothetical protein